MTIDQTRRGEILRLHNNDRLAIETVARTVGVHHSVVRRVLKESETGEISTRNFSLLT